jgi:plastocyanin
MLSRKISAYCGLGFLVLSAIGYGCGSSNNNGNGGAAGPAVTPAAPTPTVTVTIPAGASALGTAAYGTNPLVINDPSNVVWVNGDTTAHSATSDTAGLFDTGVIQPGATSSPIPFNSPGAYPYGSSVTGDAGMSGEIDVASPSPSPSASASPSPSVSVSPSPSPSVSVSPSPSVTILSH